MFEPECRASENLLPQSDSQEIFILTTNRTVGILFSRPVRDIF